MWQPNPARNLPLQNSNEFSEYLDREKLGVTAPVVAARSWRMENQRYLHARWQNCIGAVRVGIAAFLAVCLATSPAHAFFKTGSQWPASRVVAVFAGHTTSLKRHGNHQGMRSASGVWEFRYNDRVAGLFAARSTDEIHYRVIPASLNVPYQTRALVAAMVGAHALLEIHHDGVQPRIYQSLVRAGPGDPQLSYYRGFSVHIFPNSPSIVLAREIESALISAGLTWSTYHLQDIPGERMTLVPGTKATYARDRLALLTQAQMPAAIIECGCIANPSEDALMKDTRYQEKIVAAIHDAVQNFFHTHATHGGTQPDRGDLKGSDLSR